MAPTPTRTGADDDGSDTNTDDDDADLSRDEAAGTLTVRLHHFTNRTSDEAARYLAEQLSAPETEYPGTKLGVVYRLVSD